MTQCNNCQIELTELNKRKIYKRAWNVCKSCANLAKRINKAKLKNEVFEEYGSKCNCCGESNHIVLNIDHINEDGAQHRKITGGGGNSLYTWLRKHGFPKDNFQLLCFNCNFAKHMLGECFHKTQGTII